GKQAKSGQGHSRHSRYPDVSGTPRERTFGQCPRERARVSSCITVLAVGQLVLSPPAALDDSLLRQPRQHPAHVGPLKLGAGGNAVHGCFPGLRVNDATVSLALPLDDSLDDAMWALVFAQS